MAAYILGIDQSTQGTKVMLLDENGRITCRYDRAHAQLIDEKGYVEHDPEEIYANLLSLVKTLLDESGVDARDIRGVGISNQRETAMAWYHGGKPVYNAIVWQCARGAAICNGIESAGHAPFIKTRTGLQLSPYFSAAKLAWIMQNVPGVYDAALKGDVLCGTMDSYLVYRLTGGQEFRTDYSNASRTQLFDVVDLKWNEDILNLFGTPACCMAEVTDSDAHFGDTDFEGLLPHKIPIHGILGDSHGALFGQGCLTRGMMKSTYGTGSSIMMNIGPEPVFSDLGLVTSLAWKIGGQVTYVLEGNINYTGAIISWLKNDVGLITSANESEAMAKGANPQDRTYLVPAFSGLGAPYWRSDVSAAFVGMSRTSGRKELVKAGVEAIAYQIADVVFLMQQQAGINEVELRVDGGPTRNKWLMQFQSDILRCPVMVPSAEELSAMGAAFAAGMSLGLYTKDIFLSTQYERFAPQMSAADRAAKYDGWKAAVQTIL